MLTVISPAKKLDFESEAKIADFEKCKHLTKAQKLVEELKNYSVSDIKDLMKLSDTLSELNYNRFQKFSKVSKESGAKQAVYAFRGDTYKGLDADTMKASDMKFAKSNLRILSGLYGVLSPIDLILPYRLEMGTRLKVDGHKNLYEFWGSDIAKRLDEDLKNKKEKVIIHCASNEYFKSVDMKTLKAKVITPVFKENKNGEFKTIGLFAKRARGMMARFIIDNRLETPEAIKDFDVEGYKFQKKYSSDTEYVFHRK